MDRVEFCKLLMEIKGKEPMTQLSYKCRMDPKYRDVVSDSLLVIAF